MSIPSISSRSNFEGRRKMFCVETQYFNLNKILLLAVGLWPYHQTKLARLQLIFFVGILTSAILFQLTVILTSKCTSQLIVKVLCPVLSFSIFVIKYIAFALNIEAVKNLLAQLQYTYDDLKDEYENVIKEESSYNAKRYTVIFSTLAICSVFGIIVAQFWLSIFNVILSRNVSQSHDLFITTEYFIDQEKHFYFIILHTYAAICIGSTATIATGTMLIAYIQHICGMFRISSYRIKRAMRTNMLQNITLENENLMFKGIICAIDIHRQAMKLSELLISKFEIMFFCLISIGVISLSLNIFRIFQISASEDNIKEFLFPVVLVVAIVSYMFIANYIGQDVTDHNNHVIVTAYSVPWYLASLHIQRMILFLLQRGSKIFALSAGGLFTGSLECFATLLKASVSYATVMYSMQQ